jgi:trehalose 6-phosphate phosphatase
MMSLELIPAGVSKATAIAEFMQERPFRGRRPLSVGNDASDEPGFEWVNDAGGLSVAVDVTGPTAARTRLRSVNALRAWLNGLIEGPG